MQTFFKINYPHPYIKKPPDENTRWGDKKLTVYEKG